MIACSLFSGIGAPETAMPHWRWPWHAEIEKFPSAVMAQRHPDSVNLGDVTAHDFAERAAVITKPSVLVFGSPCQSFSVAGKRLGLDDPRGNLALCALGIVARLKPSWFVFENVPGLLSSSEGRDFGLFLRAVDELGYSLAWAVLDAQYFGVAQRRERVFAVGHLGDWRGPAAVLFEPEGLCGHRPPRRESGKTVAPTIASRPTGGGGLGTDFDCDGGLIAGTLGTRSAAHPSGTKSESDFMVTTEISQPLLAKSNSSHRADAESYVAHALNAHAGRIDYESETFVTHALRADGFDASEDGTGRGTPLIAIQDGRSMDKDQNGRGWNDDGAAYTLDGTGAQAIAFSCKDHGADASELAPTFARNGAHRLGRDSGDDGRGYDRPPAAMVESVGALDTVKPWNVAAQSAVRRLTPRECERLQGYPDDYTAITFRGKPAADGPRYTALGNSMAVPVMRWILTRIEALELAATE